MSSITLRFLAEPGTVMKWIDTGSTCATGSAKRYCVTISIDGIRFHRPIRIGNLVEVQARLADTGNSTRAHHH